MQREERNFVFPSSSSSGVPFLFSGESESFPSQLYCSSENKIFNEIDTEASSGPAFRFIFGLRLPKLFSCSTSRFFYSTPSRIPRFVKQTWLFLGLQIEEPVFLSFSTPSEAQSKFQESSSIHSPPLPHIWIKRKESFFPLSLFFSASFSPPLSKVGERSSKKGLKERRAAAVVRSPLERRGGVASRYNPRNWGFGRRGRFGSEERGAKRCATSKEEKEEMGFCCRNVKPRPPPFPPLLPPPLLSPPFPPPITAREKEVGKKGELPFSSPPPAKRRQKSFFLRPLLPPLPIPLRIFHRRQKEKKEVIGPLPPSLPPSTRSRLRLGYLITHIFGGGGGKR